MKGPGPEAENPPDGHHALSGLPCFDFYEFIISQEYVNYLNMMNS